MADAERSKDNSESAHVHYERRYRTEKYFLEDQLKCSEAVHDYQSVRELIKSAPQFNICSAFQFRPATVPVRNN